MSALSKPACQQKLVRGKSDRMRRAARRPRRRTLTAIIPLSQRRNFGIVEKADVPQLSAVR